LADDLEDNPPASVQEVAERWAQQFWNSYSVSLVQTIAQLRSIAQKPPFDVHNPNVPTNRTLQEVHYFNQQKQKLVVGFCLGGTVKRDRAPHAYQIVFDPLLDDKPVPEHLPQAQSFWGVPALISRLINGCADEVMNAIMQSGKW
jgi:hypothetical protein